MTEDCLALLQMATFLGQSEIQRMLNLWLHGAMEYMLRQGGVAVGSTPSPSTGALKLLAYKTYEAEWREVRIVPYNAYRSSLNVSRYQAL